MYRNSKAAFTLIELLVVITIIGLLSAILFPVFVRVRENARRTSCLSNLKQLGLSFVQYSQDFDERYPVGYHIYPTAAGGDGKPRGIGWVGPLFPYAKNQQVFRCPSDLTKSSGGRVISYAYASGIANSGNAAVSRLTAPDKTTMAFEVRNATIANFNLNEGVSTGANGDPSNGNAVSPASNGSGLINQSCKYGCNGVSDATLDAAIYATGYMANRGNINGCYKAPWSGSTGTCFEDDLGRHLEGANFLLADGHVKWYRGEQVSTGSSASTSTSTQGANAAGTDDTAYQITFSIR